MRKPMTHQAALLLADPSPCLRWLALRDLFGRPTDDPELQELAMAREHDSLLADLVAMQAPDGSWKEGGLAEVAIAV